MHPLTFADRLLFAPTRAAIRWARQSAVSRAARARLLRLRRWTVAALCKPHDFDDFDRAHAIALIASNFTDNPPSTPERAALPDDYGKALQEAVAGNRRALGLPPQEPR